MLYTRPLLFLLVFLTACAPPAPVRVLGTPISESTTPRAPLTTRPADLAGSETNPGAARTLHDADFLNRTYTGIDYACQEGDSECAFTLSDGIAPVVIDGSKQGDVSVCRVETGAFGATDETLAFVTVCLSGPGLLGNRAGAVPYYYVFRMGASGQPEVIATADEEVGASTGIDGVRSGVRADGDRLVLAGAVYANRDAMCCPSAVGEQTLAVTGGTLRPTGSLRRWPIGQAPPDPSQTTEWQVLLDRAGPFEYGQPLPARFGTSASPAACHEVRPTGAPYGLTLIVADGVVQGARMVGPNWQTRSEVGVGSWPPTVRETYGARIQDARFGSRPGLLYSPSSANPNRIGFVVRDERVVVLLGGDAEVVGRGGTCGSAPARVQAPSPASPAQSMDGFNNMIYLNHPLCSDADRATLMPCGRGRAISLQNGEAHHEGQYAEYGSVQLESVTPSPTTYDPDLVLVTHTYDLNYGNTPEAGSVVMAYDAANTTHPLASLSVAEISMVIRGATGYVAWGVTMEAGSDGTVRTSSLAGTPRARPPYHVSTTYRYANKRFIPVGQPTVEPSGM